MGVSVHARRLFAPLALGMTLVLAGSTSPLPRSDAEDAASGLSSVPVVQAPASVTDVLTPPSEAAPDAPGALAPAVRIAAARAPGRDVAATRVPAVLLAAYRAAAGSAPATCHLQVSLLAAIGEVESGSLVGDQLDAQHRTSILGPVLDGRGFAAIADTDNGRLDGDTAWDRAMGPLQFLPSTWRSFGVDGDGDGVADPQDIEDAASSAAAYLCYGGRDLAQPATLRSAILSYNHSAAYERLVMTYQQRYAQLGLDQGMTIMGVPSYGTAFGTTPATGLDLSSTEQAAQSAASSRPARDAATSSTSSPVSSLPVQSAPVIRDETSRPGLSGSGISGAANSGAGNSGAGAPRPSRPVQAGTAPAAGPGTPAHPAVKPSAEATPQSAAPATEAPAPSAAGTSSTPSATPAATSSGPAPSSTEAATSTVSGTASPTTGTPAGDPSATATGTPSATATGTPTGHPSATPTCVLVDADTPGDDHTDPTPVTTDTDCLPPCDADGNPIPVTTPTAGPTASPTASPTSGAAGTAPVCSPQPSTGASPSSGP